MIDWKSIYGYNNCIDVHTFVLNQLSDGATIVELGTAYGRGLALLLHIADTLGKRFRIVGVDTFEDNQDNTEGGYSHLSRDDTVSRLNSVTPMYTDYELIEGDSADSANLFDTVDYVFLDADHSVEGVRRDIAAWWPKVKAGGFMGGHDWDFGWVKEAVSEVFPNPQIFEKDYCNSWLVRNG
jgi:predicted O-methyltransferase YrrM